MDVLSNLAFSVFGIVGLITVWRWRGAGNSSDSLAGLFFIGLLATGPLSGWYHLQPDNPGLALDRYGMTIAFSGLLGLAACAQVSDKAGRAVAILVLAGGFGGVQVWAATGNVFPWVVLQFGGLIMMIGMACLRSDPSVLRVSWITVVLIYAVAKGLEHYDAEIFELSGEWVSGHTLKHIVASFAALPVLLALQRKRAYDQHRLTPNDRRTEAASTQ